MAPASRTTASRPLPPFSRRRPRRSSVCIRRWPTSPSRISPKHRRKARRCATRNPIRPARPGAIPSTTPEGGDAWFNNSSHWYDTPVVGNYAWLTIMHETGHLSGSSTAGCVGSVRGSCRSAPTPLEYTVMSYRSYIGASTTQGLTNATWSFPQTLMMDDIAALQYSTARTTRRTTATPSTSGTRRPARRPSTAWRRPRRRQYHFHDRSGMAAATILMISRTTPPTLRSACSPEHGRRLGGAAR